MTAVIGCVMDVNLTSCMSNEDMDMGETAMVHMVNTIPLIPQPMSIRICLRDYNSACYQ